MTKAKGFEIDILGERFPVADIVTHLFLAQQQSDAFFETLTPMELVKLSIMDNWLYNGGKLTAHCTDGHWYSAKAHRMDEGCPFCEAARRAAETHFNDLAAELIEKRNENFVPMGNLMTGEVGQVTVNIVDDDDELLTRHPALCIDSYEEFDALMNRLEKAEGYDMVYGLHAFEFKEHPDLEHMPVLNAFLYVLEERIGDDPAGPLQPLNLSAKYIKWAEQRNAR